MRKKLKHVVIVGAGFAGLFAAKKLIGKQVRVTLIDKNNYHTFNPLLYQVGSAEIEPDQIAYPVRTIIRGRNNISFLMSEVTSIRVRDRVVRTLKGDVEYDYLIVSPGSKTNYFGINGAEEHTLPLKTLDDALKLRNHILSMFEAAARSSDPDLKKKYLTFVITGGGATGVEFAGAFAELVHGPLEKDFPELKASDINIMLIDSGARILSNYMERSCAYAVNVLSKKGVRVITGAEVTRIDKDTVKLKNGDVIKSSTVIWTAGVRGMEIKTDIHLPLRSDSRILVDNTLRIKDHDDVFFCGDNTYSEQDGVPLPMTAPVATQQGIHSAHNILRLIDGKGAVPFVYLDKGSMVAIGRNSGITRIGRHEIRGFIAWVLWLFIHIFYLIGFKNKIMVMISWFGDYILYERSGRMIIPSCGENNLKNQSIR